MMFGLTHFKKLMIAGRKNARNSSWYKCLNVVRSCFFFIPQGIILLNALFAEVLAVPKNMKLLAIPLFELYDNAARYR